VLTNIKKDNFNVSLKINFCKNKVEGNLSAKVVTVIKIYRLYSSATNYLQLVQSAMLGLNGLIKKN